MGNACKTYSNEHLTLKERKSRRSSFLEKKDVEPISRKIDVAKDDKYHWIDLRDYQQLNKNVFNSFTKIIIRNNLSLHDRLHSKLDNSKIKDSDTINKQLSSPKAKYSSMKNSLFSISPNNRNVMAKENSIKTTPIQKNSISTTAKKY